MDKRLSILHCTFLTASQNLPYLQSYVGKFLSGKEKQKKRRAEVFGQSDLGSISIAHVYPDLKEEKYYP